MTAESETTSLKRRVGSAARFRASKTRPCSPAAAVIIDDLGVRPGTLHAAILRSPHAHADIEAIDCTAARAADGVVAVLTGADVKALTASLVVGVKAPIECWPIAIERVRYVGEPVAVVVACRPLPRRGRARPHRGALSAVAGGGRSARRRGAGRAHPASRRPRATSSASAAFATAIRTARLPPPASHPRRRALSAQFLHADRNLRRRRRIRSRRGCL